ncbi:hypothetical protein BOSE21B_80106 [Bosea sp. 21B]|nr:hypothetical protein BOSE21B_80106 [Bosea sp. 21B]
MSVISDILLSRLTEYYQFFLGRQIISDTGRVYLISTCDK